MAEENTRYIELQSLLVVVRYGNDAPTVTVVKTGDGALTLTPVEVAALISALQIGAGMIGVTRL
jgi:hypothetical protein